MGVNFGRRIINFTSKKKKRKKEKKEKEFFHGKEVSLITLQWDNFPSLQMDRYKTPFFIFSLHSINYFTKENDLHFFFSFFFGWTKNFIKLKHKITPSPIKLNDNNQNRD